MKLDTAHADAFYLMRCQWHHSIFAFISHKFSIHLQFCLPSLVCIIEFNNLTCRVLWAVSYSIWQETIKQNVNAQFYVHLLYLASTRIYYVREETIDSIKCIIVIITSLFWLFYSWLSDSVGSSAHEGNSMLTITLLIGMIAIDHKFLLFRHITFLTWISLSQFNASNCILYIEYVLCDIVMYIYIYR